MILTRFAYLHMLYEKHHRRCVYCNGQTHLVKPGEAYNGHDVAVIDRVDRSLPRRTPGNDFLSCRYCSHVRCAFLVKWSVDEHREAMRARAAAGHHPVNVKRKQENAA